MILARVGFIVLVLACAPSMVQAQSEWNYPGLGGAFAPTDEAPSHRALEAQSKTRFAEGLHWAQLAKATEQADYDALAYDLALTLDPDTQILSGTVTTTAQVVAPAISSLSLDLSDNMTVTAVTVAGTPVSFSHLGDRLTVDLDRSYSIGETVAVAVAYQGNPAGFSFGWDTHDGKHMIWTLSEPYGARDWWPCKDVNVDKADVVDLHVTVPSDLIVASNGLLAAIDDHGATRTFHWHTDYPMATYLVSLAVHPYSTYSDWYTPPGGSPMEVQFYVFEDHLSLVQNNYAKTVPMLDAFSRAWGEYPFVQEKYGHAEFIWGGGMEHQTLSSLGTWHEDVVSHELAHQWWGDDVTCATFHDIWLNEGFATWAEAYWKELSEGADRYHRYMALASFYGPGTIYVEDPTSFGQIFQVGLSYNKASWVVHMLRGLLGDTDFFGGLGLFRSLYTNGSATTEQLRDALEAASGKDLDTFFQQWIHGEYYPVYRYSWSPAPGGGSIDLEVKQVQTRTGTFAMSIPVTVVTSTDTFDLVLENSTANQSYSVPVAGDVQQVRIDPERWILRHVQAPVPSTEFDGGILLVNGVDWGVHGAELSSAYEASTFWGENPISFWDVFTEPAGGYATTLPAPLGHGAVPPDVMAQYSSVVWLGNDYNGDLPEWFESPIPTYIQAGGNVLLLCRRGASFLTPEGYSDYLGVTWSSTGITLQNCTASYSGLQDIPFTGSQSSSDAFLPTLGPNSTLLFKDSTDPSRGTGVHARDPAGGSQRVDGGHFVYLAGRPYRMDHAALRANVEFILQHFFTEPYTPPTAAPTGVGSDLVLAPNYPNPFTGQTVIPFSLPASGPAELSVYDVAGRRIRTLIYPARLAGKQQITWDGRDNQGTPAAAGMYFVRLRSGKRTVSQKLMLLR